MEIKLVSGNEDKSVFEGCLTWIGISLVSSNEDKSVFKGCLT